MAIIPFAKLGSLQLHGLAHSKDSPSFHLYFELQSINELKISFYLPQNEVNRYFIKYLC